MTSATTAAGPLFPEYRRGAAGPRGGRASQVIRQPSRRSTKSPAATRSAVVPGFSGRGRPATSPPANGATCSSPAEAAPSNSEAPTATP